jgi:integrase
MSGVTEAFFRSPKLGEWTDDIASGLILVVRQAKTGRLRKSWILRVAIDGKRRKIGLGVCGLAEARRRAAEARQDIREGNDPSHRAKTRQRAAARASEAARIMTFGEAVKRWSLTAPTYKNEKSALIRERAIDHLGPIHAKPLTAVAPADLVRILSSLQPETALRVYTVAKAVFEYGSVLLESEGIILNTPIALSKLRALGWSPRSRRGRQPMPAMDWRCAPQLLAELESRAEPIAQMMIFILATASRCGAARLAKGRNIDLQAKVWRVPAEDLKDSKYRTGALIVPLSDVALAAIPPGRREYVFTDERGKPFTDRAITIFIRKMRRAHPDWTDPLTGRAFTAHGMRSMFRSWAAATRQDRDLVELAMGHAVFGQVEGAYVRDPLHELRAELMERWARHCRTETAVIVPLRA